MFTNYSITTGTPKFFHLPAFLYVVEMIMSSLTILDINHYLFTYNTYILGYQKKNFWQIYCLVL